MRLKPIIKIAAYLLAVYYACWIFWWFSIGGAITPRFILLWILVGCSIGLSFFNDLARKVLIIGSILGLIFAIVDILFTFPFVDIFIVQCGLFYFASILIFQLPIFKRFYKGGDNTQDWGILIVDDDRGLLKLVKTFFLKKGFIILAAKTGEEGLTLARQYRPDLIILDVILPGISGDEVCRQLKEDSRTKDIPVVFLTVKDSRSDVLTEMEAGGVIHWTKPVDMPYFYKEITKLLGSSLS